SFIYTMDLPWTCYLVPYFEVPSQRQAGEEIELQQEDLDFACYHGDEIELSHLLSQEILLSLPMSLLCREDCKGLCPQCSQNLNQGPCQCQAMEEDHPFAVLKNFPLKKSPS
ncbi:MAG: DUF177 domain-containing protein, partial [Deltaproteobacteria bacterium]|nr:DUF177 domain-containing protein [Deltaproteobacteria bacterium]